MNCLFPTKDHPINTFCIRLLALIILFSFHYHLSIAQGSVLARSGETLPDRAFASDNQKLSLESVLNEIKAQQGISFVYQRKNIKGKYISFRINPAEDPQKILQKISQETGIGFKKIDEKLIAIYNDQPTGISPAPEGFALVKKPSNKSLVAQKTVTGVVTDETGAPLPGITVLEKGTANGTMTDTAGNYSLSTAPDAVLVFSLIGFVTKEIPVANSSTINVSMSMNISELDEVLVIGYGTQSTREITGSIESVSSEQLMDAPVAQVGQMLQGKLSGVQINQTTGRPGEGMKFQIRGAASITAGADPLYVVDGMPISGDLSDLNPNEIESISVLKDAAATSLYGSRAANGVVLVETKTAAPGETRIDLTSYLGYQSIPGARRLEMMNAAEYARFQKEITEQNNRPVDPVFQDPLQYGEGTDWYDVITRTGAIQSHNLTVSTGTEKFNASVMAGFFDQAGVVRGTGYQRFSLRVNTRFQPNDKLNIGFNLAPTYAINTNSNSDGNPYSSGGNVVSSALITTPLASPYNPDGSLALTASDPATFGNPNWLRVVQERVYEDKEQSLLSNAFIEYEIIKGLKAKTTANIQLGNSRLFQFNPSTTGALFIPPPIIPYGSENNHQFYNWVNENTLNYQTQIGEHSIEALAGFTTQRFRGETTAISASNYADDKLQAVSAAGQTVVTNDIQEWTLLSYLARLNYNYKSKYLFSASIRRDGSSRFGPDNRWGNFPSASLGWIVSEEDFWNINPVSFFKIRASYGIVGNFNIGNYTYRSTLSPANYAFGSGLFQGRAANNLGDRRLGWEKNRQFNIGTDLYLLNDRLKLTYNYYIRNTSDLLFNVDVPQSSGFDNLQTNIGELKFWGHEIALSSVNINSGKLSWNTSFNISFNRNKTVSLATPEGTLLHGMVNYGFYSHRSVTGQPIGLFYGAVQDGVYMNQEDFDNSPKHSSSQVGTIKFRDLNGDGVITFPEDYTTIGNPWPDFIYAMSNDIRYGKFDASVAIAGSYGNQILAHHENWTTNLDGVFNVLKEVNDRWKSPEDPGKGKYGSTQQGTTFLERDRWHTRYIKDGSYLSFKNITIGYTIPLNQNSMVRNLRIYGSVQNAFVITNYPGPNPEVNTQNDGSGSTPGVDENSYPVPRTLSLGLNVGF